MGDSRVSLQKGNKQTQWEELTDIVEEPDTYSQRNTRKKVLNIFLPTSELTRSMILLMLRVTEHSRKVCHTNITMVRVAVFNVTKRAVGVIVNKKLGNRIIPKRVNIRVEHVKHSKCRDDFLRRVKENEVKKRV